MSNLLKLGDIIQLKESERKYVKVKYGKHYKILGFEDNTGYSDDSQWITALEDVRTGETIKLKMCESFWERVTKKFKVGDKVCIKTRYWQEQQETLKRFGFVEPCIDKSYEVSYVSESGSELSLVGTSFLFYAEYFELVKLDLSYVIPTNQWNTPITPSVIEKPILEERKIGKVKMQLFDEGFPNAVLEVAKVMTWAEQNKGYSPHDWKKLPNADTEFSAAASRHKLKAFVQKVEGIPAIDRTDEESNIVHLAHQAFNILAELELVLTGKIK
jgi:hypothetical protein